MIGKSSAVSGGWWITITVTFVLVLQQDCLLIVGAGDHGGRGRKWRSSWRVAHDAETERGDQCIAWSMMSMFDGATTIKHVSCNVGVRPRAEGLGGDGVFSTTSEYDHCQHRTVSQSRRSSVFRVLLKPKLLSSRACGRVDSTVYDQASTDRD